VPVSAQDLDLELDHVLERVPSRGKVDLAVRLVGMVQDAAEGGAVATLGKQEDAGAAEIDELLTERDERLTQRRQEDA